MIEPGAELLWFVPERAHLSLVPDRPVSEDHIETLRVRGIPVATSLDDDVTDTRASAACFAQLT